MAWVVQKSHRSLSYRREKISSENLYTELNNLWEDFQENHRAFESKGNKAAGGRARKSLGEIKKLVTGYRQASVSESK